MNLHYQNEDWKHVVGYEGLYLVSSLGNIKSLYKDNYRKLSVRADGYLSVQLHKDKKRKTLTVHRIVMLAFKPVKYLDNREVDHISGIKTDNRLINLRWVTRGENIAHAFTLGAQNIKGAKNPNAKLTLKDVKEIRASKLAVKDLAKIYDVGLSAIYRVRKGTSWK